MEESKASEVEVGESLLSIGQVARETGIAVETLRIWERRYGRPEPQRLPSGHRRYRPEEVARLRRVAQALALGYRPGRVLRASDDEVRQLLSTDSESSELTPQQRAWVESVRRFEGPELVRGLLELWRDTEVGAFLGDTISPLVGAVGSAVTAGELGVRHERYFDEVLGLFLRSLRGSVSTARSTRPGCLLATLEGEHHDLGLQMLALLLAYRGVRPLVLGTGLPTMEIATAARETEVPAVAVSVSLASASAETTRSLAELRRLLPARVQLAAGGRGAHRRGKKPPGVHVFESMDDFHGWLRGLP